MTPDQKPEWFQLADADKTASTRKVSKGLPVMALVAVAAILGVGTVVAQTQEESPANATETVATAVVDSTQTSANSEPLAPSTNQVSATTANNAPAVTSASKESLAPNTTAPAAPKAAPTAPKAPGSGGIANPLGQKPRGGEHDDDDEDEDEDEGDDD